MVRALMLLMVRFAAISHNMAVFFEVMPVLVQ